MSMDDGKLVKIYLARIGESPKILDANKSDILKYYNQRSSNGVALGSNRYVLFILWRLGEFLQKPFRESSADELMAFFCELKPTVINGVAGESYSPRTLWTYKAAVKSYWKWLFGIGRKSRDCPKAVEWIERNGKLLKTHIPKDVLTKEEVNEVIKAASSLRDKALTAVLFDTGLRCGELLNMRRSQIKFFEDYAEFEANGKTGERGCMIVESAPYLKAYLDWIDKTGVAKKGFEDHVWLNLNKSGWTNNYGSKPRNALEERGTALKRDAVSLILQRAVKKARINKKVWTHLMRHSSATYWAQFMNESEMRIKFGWSKESTMPSVYINLDYSKVKEKQLKKAGIWKEPDTNEKEMFKIRDCPFCSLHNPFDADFCARCGKPMSVAKIKESEKQVQTLETMQALISELKRLEDRGFDIGQFNSFMQDWSKNKEKKEVY